MPDLAPLLRGATRGIRADILIRGWLTEPSGVVQSLQEENPPSVSLHVVAYDRFGVVRIYGSHVPGLGLAKVAVSSVIEQLHIRGDFFFFSPLFAALCPFVSCILLVFYFTFYYCTIILFLSYILSVVSGVSVVSVSSAFSPSVLLFPFSILVSLLPLLLFPLLFLLLFLPLLFLFYIFLLPLSVCPMFRLPIS